MATIIKGKSNSFKIGFENLDLTAFDSISVVIGGEPVSQQNLTVTAAELEVSIGKDTALPDGLYDITVDGLTGGDTMRLIGPGVKQLSQVRVIS